MAAFAAHASDSYRNWYCKPFLLPDLFRMPTPTRDEFKTVIDGTKIEHTHFTIIYIFFTFKNVLQ